MGHVLTSKGGNFRDRGAIKETYNSSLPLNENAVKIGEYCFGHQQAEETFVS